MPDVLRQINSDVDPSMRFLRVFLHRKRTASAALRSTYRLIRQVRPGGKDMRSYEQEHRFVKPITGPMMGFEAFHSAEATIAGVEAAHMIRKDQIPANGANAIKTIAAPAAQVCRPVSLTRLIARFATQPRQSPPDHSRRTARTASPRS